MDNPLLAGIDIGKQQNDVCVLSQNDETIVRHRRFANNRLGSQALQVWLEEQRAAGEHDGIQVGAEATGLLWVHTFWQLQAADELNLELYVFNARSIKSFKKSLGEKEKTDPKDAYAIAQWLRFGHLPHPYQLDQHYLALQRLTRYRYHLAGCLTTEKVYARQVMLYLKMNTYAPGRPFSDPFSVSGLRVLSDHATIDELADSDLDELTAQLRAASRERLTDPAATAQQLQQLAAAAFPLPAGLVEPINFLLDLSLAQIRCLRQQLAQLDQRIHELAIRLPGYAHLLSVPGIGPVYAAGLIAEIQAVQRFMIDEQGRPRSQHQGHSALASYAGLWWPRSQSGGFEARERRLAKNGSRYLRYYLVEAANSLRHHEPEYRAFYQRKFAQSSRHPHRRAVTLTARKLIRLIFSLLLEDRDYQPPRRCFT